MNEEEQELYYPASQAEWRTWLAENHQSKDAVWLLYYKKKSKIPSLSWSEAVDEALCFGWIDSTKKTVDEDRYKQLFTKRKAKSSWSKINKDKIKQLSQTGKLMQAGLDCVEIAKQNGMWTLLDEVEQLIIPEDLEQAFENNPNSKTFFLSLTKSDKKGLLYWIVIAKRAETRQKRILEITELASQGLKPKSFR